ncbi:MAG TPA: hypothetical protein VGJ28_15915 [Micromonosporaceae bacterium]
MGPPLGRTLSAVGRRAARPGVGRAADGGWATWRTLAGPGAASSMAGMIVVAVTGRGRGARLRWPLPGLRAT